MTAFSVFLLALVTGAAAGLTTSSVGPALVTGLGVVLFAALGINGLTVGPVAKLIGGESRDGAVLQISPLLTVSVSLGLLLGIPLGIVTRTHRWLAPSREAFLQRYKGAGLSDAEILRAWMQSEVGGAAGGAAITSEGKPRNDGSSAGLYSDPLQEAGCVELMAKRAAGTLRKEDFVTSQFRGFRLLGQHMNFDTLSQVQLGELAAAFCSGASK